MAWIVDEDGVSGVLVDVDGDEVIVRPHEEGQPNVRLPRTALARDGVDEETSKALIDRLATPLEGEASLDDRDVASLSPEELVDAFRAARLVAAKEDLDEAGASAVSAVFSAAQRLFLELALMAQVPLVEVKYRAALGQTAEEPRALRRHVYVGSFVNQGKALNVSDVCHMSERTRALRARVTARTGTYHTWVGWRDRLGTESSLLVVHESALRDLRKPFEDKEGLGNDGGVLGVFDSGTDKGYRKRAKERASWGLSPRGVLWNRGVVAETQGDGVWPLAVYVDEKQATMVRVGLHTGVNLRSPLEFEGDEQTDSRPYSPKDKYERGDYIDHPTFDRGQVVAVMEGKVEVSFPAGTRVLVHGR